MTQKEISQLLGSVGALIEKSHFVYTSGRHGDTYVNKDALYPHTAITSQVCSALAKPFANSGIDAVVAPALGAIVLSQWVAHHLSQITQREVLSLYAEKDRDGSFILRRGYEKLIKGKKILVVEDVVTTGGSVNKVIQCVRINGGDIRGVALLCNRGGIKEKELENIPMFFSLLNLDLESWGADECPLCQKNIPFNPHLGKQL